MNTSQNPINCRLDSKSKAHRPVVMDKGHRIGLKSAVKMLDNQQSWSLGCTPTHSWSVS